LNAVVDVFIKQSTSEERGQAQRPGKNSPVIKIGSFRDASQRWARNP
jgi:hypothetical protein